MKKRMMADVLWEAANKHLITDEADEANLCEWSCNAALAAENSSFIREWGIHIEDRKASATDKFLKSLGCATGGNKGKFLKYRRGSERQGVRYMWLVLASLVAEDEGLTL